jgi:ubiquitin-conjugating enzyme E2 I
LINDEPNLESPAQLDPLNLYKTNREEYRKKVREFAMSQKKKSWVASEW